MATWRPSPARGTGGWRAAGPRWRSGSRRCTRAWCPRVSRLPGWPRPMDLIVIIPCRGQGHLLPECLRSVLGQRETGEYEVIVVDSAGDDRGAEAVAWYPAVRLVRRSEPLFPGPARHLGVGRARGR